MICYLVFDDSYTKESNIRDIVRGYYEFLLSEVKKTELFFLIVYRNMLIAKINPNLKTSRVYLYFHKRTKI